MTIAAGTKLGQFEIAEAIGAGGMGEVYRARDTKLGREVAIKVLPETFSNDEEMLTRFEREAKAIAALSHPNILAIYDFGNQNGVWFVVTELLDGETLRVRLVDGPLAPGKSVDYARQLAEGLAAAHERGFVHRDLKPENVFVTRDGRVKLLDFGLAKEVEPPLEPEGKTRAHATRYGQVMGTVGYMSPEQIRGERTDLRSDVFSFGLVLYEMLVGHRPFIRASASETISAVLRDEPTSLSSQGVEVPSGLEKIVQRCLEKSPVERFNSARDLAFALSTALEESGHDQVASAKTPSLVVLPFTNLSSDPADEYFSDGLTDEIITDLSRVRGLQVVSSPSAFRLKGTDKTVREVGEGLKVQYVLVGRVRKSGQNVRMTAQLIDVRDDRTVWADKYTGDLDQVFELQEQVSRAIADALEVRLSGSFQAPKAEAGEAYLKGRHFYRQATTEGLGKALECFEQVTELDPDYAAGYAGIADTLVWLTALWDALPARETMPRARSAAQRALELEPQLPAAHVALGAVATYAAWDPRLAERSFQEALRLNPNDAMALFWYTHPLIFLDTRFDEALSHAQRATELNPVDPWIQWGHSMVHYFSRNFEAAIEQARQLIVLEPLWGLGHYELGTSLATSGRLAEAEASLHRAIELDGRGVHHLAWLGCTYALAGRHIDARECLAELETHERQGRDVASWKLVIGAGFGDADLVMRCLLKAFEERSASLVYHLTHPFVDCVREDPRFADLLRRMNLEHLVSYRGSPEWRPKPR